jgi:hypothetical protein
MQEQAGLAECECACALNFSVHLPQAAHTHAPLRSAPPRTLDPVHHCKLCLCRDGVGWEHDEHKGARSAHKVTAAHSPQAARTRHLRTPAPRTPCSCAAPRTVLVLSWCWLRSGARGSRRYMPTACMVDRSLSAMAETGITVLISNVFHNCLVGRVWWREWKTRKKIAESTAQNLSHPRILGQSILIYSKCLCPVL